MSERVDTKEACTIIGCDKATISRWARRLGIGRKFGRSWGLTLKEVELIRSKAPLKAGNPLGWKPGNATKQAKKCGK